MGANTSALYAHQSYDSKLTRGTGQFHCYRRPSFPQGGLDSHKYRHERLARAERRRTIPVCQLPETDEDGDDSDEGDSDDDDIEEEMGDYRGDYQADHHSRSSRRPRSGAQLHCRGCPLFSTNRRHHQRLLSPGRNIAENSPRRGSRVQDGEVGEESVGTCSSPNLLQPPPLIAPSNTSRNATVRCRCGLFQNGNTRQGGGRYKNNNDKKWRPDHRERSGSQVGYTKEDTADSQTATDDVCIVAVDGNPSRKWPSVGWDDERTALSCNTGGKDGTSDGDDAGGDRIEAGIHSEKSPHKADLSGRNILHVNNNSVKKPRRKRRTRETVIINVGGQTFETYRSTLRRLRTPIFDSDAAMQRYFRRSHGDYFFDRDATAFSSVLNFLRTGELHIPTNMCGPALQSELEFWGIEEVDIARCCWTQYNTWKTQCRSLEKLEYDRKFSTTQQSNTVDPDASAWSKFRARVWTLLQDPGSSKLAKVYAWVSIIFVFVSIFSFCAETHPLFKVKAKDMTHLAAFYQFFNVEHIQFGDIEIAGNGTNQTGTNFSINGDASAKGFVPLPNNASRTDPFNLSNSSPPSTPTVKATTVAYITTNDRTDDTRQNSDECDDDEYAYLAHGGSGIGGGMRLLREGIKCARKSDDDEKDWRERELPHPALLIMDVCCLAFFTLEYMTRFTCSPNKADFLRALQNIVDFLAFAPDYVEIMFLVVGPDQGKEGVAVMEMLFILRILRLFRIFRLIRHVPGLWILLYTLKASFNELMLMCVFLLIGMVVFATLIHFAEPDGIFSNIPVGFWWAVVTMTTVGYGDMYPQSPAGYFIGSCCAVAGLLMIAFTVPIIVSNFVLYYTHVQYGLARKDREMEKLLEEEMMEDELEALERSRSQLNVAVPAEGDASRGDGKGNNCKKGDGKEQRGSTKSLNSKVASLESPCPEKRQKRLSPHRYMMSAFTLAPLQKKMRSSSSRESVASSKASVSLQAVSPPSSAANGPQQGARTGSLKSASTVSTTFLTTPAKSPKPKTTVRNGKCYFGVTSKSDTDLSPSHSLFPKAGSKTPPLFLKEISSDKSNEAESRQTKKAQRGNKVMDTNLGVTDLNKDLLGDERRGSCTIVLLDDNPPA